MKSNKIVRPMRKFGDLLKDEKDNFIFATIELLNERIQINGQNTKH